MPASSSLRSSRPRRLPHGGHPEAAITMSDRGRVVIGIPPETRHSASAPEADPPDHWMEWKADVSGPKLRCNLRGGGTNGTLESQARPPSSSTLGQGRVACRPATSSHVGYLGDSYRGLGKPVVFDPASACRSDPCASDYLGNPETRLTRGMSALGRIATFAPGPIADLRLIGDKRTLKAAVPVEAGPCHLLGR